ncbi:protein kinase domain protein [Ichthyophthirius multifiliis]|uniref:Protein kinase domain protein n=1 Tax=Ichthyophthirius multifiliis TaxID=5932 RepID=G0R695_ICHMU|nr:protein kinase domain protein [Ichthyophthirius multifiliis]EGR27022.1 protein kinase domain protein [Ichthyophthirius multifiliis]|eukprot:XP_004023906.1 protein kinase domain protein [Ichthyophthirius multifiliis]
MEDQLQNKIFKVCDVGVGTQINPDQDNTINRSIIGTKTYMAPEIYDNLNEQFSEYNPFKSDVFSLGLLFIELCTFENIGLYQIIKQMLIYDKNERPCFLKIQELTKNLKIRSYSMFQFAKQKSHQIWEGILSNTNFNQQIQEIIDNNCSYLKINLDRFETEKQQQALLLLREQLAKLKLVKYYFIIDQQKITIDQSQMISQILAKQTSLSNLQIQFYNNSLGEAGAINIFKGISQCTNLRILHINISHNSILSSSIINGFQCLRNLENLEELMIDFTSNGLQIECTDTLSNTISQFSNLKILIIKLSNNELTYKGIKILTEAYKKLNQINQLHLNFSQNKEHFGDQGFIEIGNLIEQQPKLTDLCIVLSVNKLKNRGLEQFSLSLKKLKKLKSLSLYLWGNQIQGSAFQMLGQALQELENLQDLQLNLSNNKITLQGIKEISKGLQLKSKLKNVKLIMDGCDLNTEDMVYIGKIIENRNLKSFYLNISNNKINFDGISHLAQGIRNSLNLEELSLNFNHMGGISGLGHILLFQHIVKCEKLNSLFYSAQQCDIKEKEFEEITKILGPQKNIIYLSLDLDNNLISDKAKSQFKLDIESYFKQNKLIELSI